MEKPRHDVFLCYNQHDKPAVRRIARFLKEHRIEPWLDEWNEIPGEPWQEAIERALLGCAACAVFLGPDGTGPWQDEEIRTAINRQISEGRLRVIPVFCSPEQTVETVAGFLDSWFAASGWSYMPSMTQRVYGD